MASEFGEAALQRLDAVTVGEQRSGRRPADIELKRDNSSAYYTAFARAGTPVLVRLSLANHCQIEVSRLSAIR